MINSETNCAVLQGKIISHMRYSHKTYGEAFYEIMLSVERKSGYCDEIRVMLSDRLIFTENLKIGSLIRVQGQIRTYNEDCSGKSHLNIVVFAKSIEITDTGHSENFVYMSGYICKPTVRRTSPLGRELCDIMLAVNRMYGKSDYIPCIAWGRNAAYCGRLEVGDRLNVTGRMQSRIYKKKLENGDIVDKVAYEVSILKIEE